MHLIFLKKNFIRFCVEHGLQDGRKRAGRTVSIELVGDDDVLKLELVAMEVARSVTLLYIVLKEKQRDFVEKLNVEMGKQEKSILPDF